MCSRSSLPEPSPSQEGSHCLPCSTPHQQSGADSPKWHQLVPGTRSQYLPCWISQGSTSDHGEGDGSPLQYSCLENPMDGGAWWAAVHGVAQSLTRLSDFTFTFHFHTLEKEMATHSNVLALRIPGTGEPGGLPSMGSHRVGHN